MRKISNTRAWLIAPALLVALVLTNGSAADALNSRLPTASGATGAAMGLAVSCYLNPVQHLQNNEVLPCFAYDATFSSVNPVPPDHYLVVTDISYSTESTSTPRQTKAGLMTDPMRLGQSYQLNCKTGETCSEHFKAPALIVYPGQRLVGSFLTGENGNLGLLSVRGILVLADDLNRMPL